MAEFSDSAWRPDMSGGLGHQARQPERLEVSGACSLLTGDGQKSGIGMVSQNCLYELAV
jgi:hypothetical protein